MKIKKKYIKLKEKLKIEGMVKKFNIALARN